jgi:hypothetical protein
MMAHKIDLFLLQETTTAIIVPSPMPGPTYTGIAYPPSFGPPRQEKRKNRGIK